MYKRPRRQQEAIIKLDAAKLDDQLKNIENGIYNLKEQGISQSLLTNWACRIKFILKLNRWSTIESGKNTYYGSIVHHILERVYKKDAKTMPGKKDIRVWIDEYIGKHEKEMTIWTDNKSELAAGMCQVVMEKYCKYYASDFQEIEVYAPETKFSVPFQNTILKGMRDLLFYYKGKKEMCLMEHKTMGRVEEKVLLRRLRIDKQLFFYVTASEESNGKKINQVLYNVIRKPQIKYDEKNTIVDFLKRLSDDIDSRPDFYFLRYPITITEKDKSIYKEQLKNKLLDIEDFLHGKLRVYREEDMCESAYNGSPYVCEYIDVCATGLLKGFIQQKSLFPELE